MPILVFFNHLNGELVCQQFVIVVYPDHTQILFLNHESVLSPYPCFISLLYLDLYVLGDDALIS